MFVPPCFALWETEKNRSRWQPYSVFKNI